MAARLLVVAAVANAALAFSNTSPVVAWSSSSSYALDSLPARLDSTYHTVSLLESILSSEDICNHDAVVLVNQPGLHASDLRTLEPSTHIARSIASAHSSRQYPYLPSHHSHANGILSLAESVSSKCGSRLLQYAPGKDKVTLQPNSKHVLCMNMPHLDKSGHSRKTTMAQHESLLGDELSSITSSFPNHLIIFTGSPLGSHSKRQVPDRPILDLSSDSFSSFAPTNTTLPTGGVLKRYQLLTPGLITALLIAFFVLVPVVMMGMKALASIQNPIRVDVSKSYNAQERKNQ
ncbi:hypothetical protein JR316_0005127 [Psilocybe cubensis]|uniref:Protein BIG1 n=2 Tax=Psilocybe cubensis TaxID=181762 RepID=A0A8H8CM21_PSICU|nr:hypothetical protein JR316_0005127 [Psilocybe cubensis]KAH9483027.1 hypothetical protein JR316_0005127 [Psilocybe cubensis]